MKKSWLIAGGILIGLYLLYEQTLSTDGTNSDGSATDGTDADIISSIQVALDLVPDYIGAWADAITIHEGWAPGSRSYRNNNPGNMEIAGDLGVDSGGFGIWSSYNGGRNALLSDLTAKCRKYSSWTVYAIMARYAPPSENDTSAYAAAIAQALGCSITTPASTIPGIWSSQGLAWTPVDFPAQDGTPAVAAAPASSGMQDVSVDSSSSPSDISTMSVTDMEDEAITGIDPNAVDLSNLDTSGGD